LKRSLARPVRPGYDGWTAGGAELTEARSGPDPDERVDALRFRGAAGSHPGPERVGRAVAELVHSDVAISEFAFGQPTLDEVFLALTGRRAPADNQATDDEAA
jgi:hypothetical protein